MTPDLAATAGWAATVPPWLAQAAIITVCIAVVAYVARKAHQAAHDTRPRPEAEYEAPAAKFNPNSKPPTFECAAGTCDCVEEQIAIENTISRIKERMAGDCE